MRGAFKEAPDCQEPAMKDKSNTLAPIIIPLTLLFLTGCASTKAYNGPDRPRSEIAVVKPELRTVGSFLGVPEKECAIIVEVDGKKMGDSFRGYPRYIEILPGRHTIKADYSTTKRKNITAATGGGLIPALIESSANSGIADPRPQILSFQAEAGQDYRIKTRTRNGKGHDLRMWIVHAMTGKVVSNTTGKPVLSLEKSFPAFKKEDSVDDRLSELSELLDKGLITEEEYNAKKETLAQQPL